MILIAYKFPNYNDVADGSYIHYVENSQRTEKPHAHPFFQIVFVLKGKLTQHINGVSADVSIGEMTIIPPDVLHYISLENNPTFYSFSFTESTFGAINSINKQAMTFLKSLKEMKEPILPKTTIADDDILHVKSLFERIHKEAEQKEMGFEENIRSYGILLITQFIRRYYITNPGSIQSGGYTNEQMVLNCINYIDENFTENLNLDTVSHMAAVSESTFCSCFKKITGHTFQSYLNQKRVDFAVELINKGYKITAVSSFCGYNDFTTFSRNFKKIVGMSPTEYRRRQDFITEKNETSKPHLLSP